ncbi:hypothetical protein [Nocardioides sp. MH1]|uniref:hypothetical protein n=1 Tax=Nocardioides sp. MH1 TaxID=3242490 RepID=UPI003520F186
MHNPPDQAPHRATGLFGIRESDEWDRQLFDAMRQQTYARFRHVPEVQAIIAAGLAPLDAPDSFEVTFQPDGQEPITETVVIEHLSRGSTKAILFHHRDYWHLWSQASAAKTGDQGINDFTAILIDVIERIRPLNLYAANVSRLVRSLSQGHRLQAALDGNVDTVWAGDLPFAFTGPHKVVGSMMFSMFAMIASMERDWIVQRLLAGRIAKWRRNEWPFGKNTIPFGYRLDDARRLVPDPELRPTVREMLMILSNYDTPPSELVRQLNRIGVTGMRKHRRLDINMPAGALASPDSFITSLYAWAPLWIQGEYLWRVSNAFADMDEIAGLPVVRHPNNDEDPGEVQMLYCPGVPDNGWAEPEILASFAAAATARTKRLKSNDRTPPRPLSPTVSNSSADPVLHSQLMNSLHARLLDNTHRDRRRAARAQQRIAPFAGREWTEGEWHYELQVLHTGTYRLIRWPNSRQEGR